MNFLVSMKFDEDVLKIMKKRKVLWS